MKKAAVLLAALLLAGCDSTVYLQSGLNDKADELCKPHGGVAFTTLTQDGMQCSYFLLAHCNNKVRVGTHVKRTQDTDCRRKQ